MKKFKSMLSLLAASVLALTCFTVPAFAADVEEETILYQAEKITDINVILENAVWQNDSVQAYSQDVNEQKGTFSQKLEEKIIANGTVEQSYVETGLTVLPRTATPNPSVGDMERYDMILTCSLYYTERIASSGNTEYQVDKVVTNIYNNGNLSGSKSGNHCYCIMSASPSILRRTTISCNSVASQQEFTLTSTHRSFYQTAATGEGCYSEGIYAQSEITLGNGNKMKAEAFIVYGW